MNDEQNVYDVTDDAGNHAGTADAPAGRYGDQVFSADQAGELPRLLALAEVFDPSSRRHLSALGVTAGWRCLDVGAGPGTMAHWLAQVVGPGGEVVAVDKDIHLLDTRGRGNLRVVRTDVTAHVPDLGQFDLVHSRFMLTHLPERAQVIQRLAEWVAPGGWLVLTDAIDAGMASSPHDAFRRTLTALMRTLADLIGTDADCGRYYPGPLRACGLTEIDMAAELPVLAGASRFAEFWRASIDELRPAVISAGLLDDATVDAAIAHLDDPETREVTFGAITAWGRKPARDSI